MRAKIPASEIKGFISVLPKDQDPQFVKEIGQIQRTILEYGVEEINIGTVSVFSGIRPLTSTANRKKECCPAIRSLQGRVLPRLVPHRKQSC